MKWTNDKVEQAIEAINTLSQLGILAKIDEALLEDAVVALSGWTRYECAVVKKIVKKISHLQIEYLSGNISRTERDENISLTLSLQ